MRKTKRFTPELQDKFERDGRGTGNFGKYKPHHRVSRSDPSSRGRSHLVFIDGRHKELLSNGEDKALCFALKLPYLIDIKEQFPLSMGSSQHERSEYLHNDILEFFPGTKAISDQLGVKHPVVTGIGKGNSKHWIMTTDLLLVFKNNTKISLLAISCKPTNKDFTDRDLQLFEIEKQYWVKRDVEWLMITPELYDNKVADTLLRTLHWVKDSEVSLEILNKSAFEMRKFIDLSETAALDYLEKLLGNSETAKKAFWQNIWSGVVPIDLRRGWRPHEPLKLLHPREFWELNPIAARRTAWK